MVLLHVAGARRHSPLPLDRMAAACPFAHADALETERKARLATSHQKRGTPHSPPTTALARGRAAARACAAKKARDGSRIQCTAGLVCPKRGGVAGGVHTKQPGHPSRR